MRSKWRLPAPGAILTRSGGIVSLNWSRHPSAADRPGRHAGERRLPRSAFRGARHERIIDPENRDSDTANRRAANEISILPVKCRVHL